jgi:ribosome-associated heat shock protein Hsp15
MTTPEDGHGPGQRLDKFLWSARFLKSRSLAAALCAAGRIRVSGRVVDKAHTLVRVGDVLTFPLGPGIRVVRILALPTRRGPAAEARTLYEEL